MGDPVENLVIWAKDGLSLLFAVVRERHFLECDDMI
jgi:hypothetical protein